MASSLLIRRAVTRLATRHYVLQRPTMVAFFSAEVEKPVPGVGEFKTSTGLVSTLVCLAGDEGGVGRSRSGRE